MTPSTSAADSTAANPRIVDTIAEGEQPLSLRQRWLYGLGAVVAGYGLMASVDGLSAGFRLVIGPQVNWLIDLAGNPFLGLLVGIIATALVQSSSVVTSILVAMVAGGLPIAIAIPMVMGANVGTTLTNTLVSLGYVGEDDAFERGFAAATVHDIFNLLALLLFFPLELTLHPLAHLSQWLTVQIPAGLTLSWANLPLTAWLLWPMRWVWATLVNQLPPPWDSLLLFSLSIAGIMVAVTGLSGLLKQFFTGQWETQLQRLMGRGSAWGLASGAGLTALLQSSSVSTSLMVPLASANLISLETVYPFVLGANIGTCITAILAALAVPGTSLPLQLALVHLSFNVLGVALIYGLPWLRQLPPITARWLASWVTQYRLLAIVYVFTLFFILPGSLVWVTLRLI
jgi:sodium-dependent phosphate cotransporter